MRAGIDSNPLYPTRKLKTVCQREELVDKRAVDSAESGREYELSQPPEVITYTEETISNLSPDAWYGLYVVRSRTEDRSIFRVGAAGFSGSIISRLKSHRKGPARNRAKPPNWTELFRPFDPVWVAHLVGATRAGTLTAERQLLVEFARHYQFVSDSGFCDPSENIERIISIAQGTVDEIHRLLLAQRASFFRKASHNGARWVAVDDAEGSEIA